jgi:hypothetical protein
MKTMTKILALGGAAAVAGTLGWAALADMPMHRGQHGMEMGAGMGMGPGMMQQMMQHMGPGMGHGMGGGAMQGGPGHAALADPAQVETLKTELGITPAQEPAWDKYATTLQESAATMKTAHESVDPEAVGKMSPPDRFAFVTRMREQGQKQLETVQKAANDLLAALDETQKAKAADILPGLAARGPGAMHGTAMGGPQHGHPGR